MRNEKVNIVQKAANRAKKPPKNSPPRIHRKMWKKSAKISSGAKNFRFSAKKIRFVCEKFSSFCEKISPGNKVVIKY